MSTPTPRLGLPLFAGGDLRSRANMDALITAIDTNAGARADDGQQVLSVKAAGYGAVGDGVHDDGAIINSALTAVSNAGGGIVYLPIGTYRTTVQILLQPGVLLRGAGMTASIIQGYNLADGFWLVSNPNGAANFGMENVGVTVSGGVGSHVLVAIQQATDVLLHNVATTGGQVGIVIRSAHGSTTPPRRVRADGLVIKNVLKTPTDVTNGIGLWLFMDVRDCQFSNVLIDGVDGGGLLLDAGTTDGFGIEVANNVFSNITVRNAARVAGLSTMCGIGLEGSHYNTFSNFLIDTVTNYSGIHLSCDQTTVVGQVPSSDNNVFVGGVIRNCGQSAIQIDGGSHNQFSHVAIQDFQTLGAGSNTPITLQSTTGTNGTFSANDNRFFALDVQQEAAYVADYTFAVALNAQDTGAVGTVLRNRFIHCAWGSTAANGIGSGGPASGFLVQGTPSGARSAATVAPIIGANANFSDMWGLDGSTGGQGLFLGFNRSFGFRAAGDTGTIALATGADLFTDFGGAHALRVNSGFVVPYPDNSVQLGLGTNRWSNLFAVGDVQIGASGPATTATTGMVWIPSMAGAPTGAPTARTGYAALVYDSTDHKLYAWDGTTWRGTAAMT